MPLRKGRQLQCNITTDSSGAQGQVDAIVAARKTAPAMAVTAGHRNADAGVLQLSQQGMVGAAGKPAPVAQEDMELCHCSTKARKARPR